MVIKILFFSCGASEYGIRRAVEKETNVGPYCGRACSRASTIFNWPCTSTARRYFRSARLEAAVCARQRSEADRNFTVCRETLPLRSERKKIPARCRSNFGSSWDRLVLRSRRMKRTIGTVSFPSQKLDRANVSRFGGRAIV